MKTLTTNEAREYISKQTGKTGKPLQKSQLMRYIKRGWIKQHEIGTHGKQSTYSVDDLDRLCAKINYLADVYKIP